MPCLCNKKIDRQQAKINCGDCKNYYHAECVNLLASDIEYFSRSKTTYRCDSCTALRRKSLQSTSTKTKDVRTVQHNLGESPKVAAENILNGIDTVMPGTITLQQIYKEIIELKNVNTNALALIKNLQAEKKFLLEKINDLEQKVNSLEQLQQSDALEFVGIPNVDNNNAMEKVQRIIADGVGVEISADHIEKCYVKRIKINKPSTPHKNDNQLYRDVVSVKFNSKKYKDVIMKKKSNEKIRLTGSIFGKEFANTNIYINESLTTYSRKLFLAAKKTKHEKHFKYLWTRDGKILMRKIDGEKYIVIKSFDDLKLL